MFVAVSHRRGTSRCLICTMEMQWSDSHLQELCARCKVSQPSIWKRSIYAGGEPHMALGTLASANRWNQRREKAVHPLQFTTEGIHTSLWSSRTIIILTIMWIITICNRNVSAVWTVVVTITAFIFAEFTFSTRTAGCT